MSQILNSENIIKLSYDLHLPSNSESEDEMPEMSNNLKKKFKNGLSQYNLTLEDLKRYKYCGGTKDSHGSYFRKTFENILKINPNWKPPHHTQCICGKDIIENCYIIEETFIPTGRETPQQLRTTNKLLVLGNCCIKRFVEKCGRTCEICGDKHRNIVVNKCNKCKITVGWTYVSCLSIYFDNYL